MAPRFPAALLTIAVAIGLSGCIFVPGLDGSTGGSNGRVIDFQPTGETVEADLAPFYGQDVQWTLCQDSFTCGTIAVPMDWDNPGDGRTMDVSMIARPATGERWGSMLYNPGGPGASGIEYVTNYAEYLVDAQVLEHYDLIGFDPRGVGQSSPISCYDDPSTLYHWLFDIPAGEPSADDLSDAALAEQLASAQDFGADCLTHTGEALQYVGTTQAARDMDIIRAVTGEQKLQYLGVSYGTLLGATYADYFPDKVGRFVLDAAISPDSTDFEGSLYQAGGFELALTNFAEDCSQRTDCPFNGDRADILRQISELLDELDASPMPHSDGRELGSSSMITAIASALYSESSWSSLRKIFTDVNDSETDSAFAAVDSYYGINSDGSFADNSFEALIAVNCLDYPAVTDGDEVRANAEQILAAAPVLGRSFVGLSTCAGWPFAATRTPHEVTAPGADPIIVIGGLNDPATPYQWSVDLASSLESGVLISVDAEGHSQYNSSNRCVADPVDTYFLTGVAPTADLDC